MLHWRNVSRLTWLIIITCVWRRMQAWSVVADPRNQGVSWPPMLEVRVKDISLTPIKVWVMWCSCFCPALTSTFSYLKCRILTRSWNFSGVLPRTPATGGGHSSRTFPRPSPCFEPDIFNALLLLRIYTALTAWNFSRVKFGRTAVVSHSAISALGTGTCCIGVDS